MRLASEITRSPTFPPSVTMTRFFSILLTQVEVLRWESVRRDRTSAAPGGGHLFALIGSDLYPCCMGIRVIATRLFCALFDEIGCDSPKPRV